MKPAWALTARTGPVRKYKDLSFFACEGLIAVHDDRDGSYTAVTPDDFTKRVEMLEKKSKKAKADCELTPSQRQYRRSVVQFAADMTEAVKEAKYMGDPSDPQVMAFWQRQRKNSTVRLSAGSDAAGYPDLPEIPLGNITGRTAAVDGQLSTADVPTIHTPPRRKNRSGLILAADVL